MVGRWRRHVGAALLVASGLLTLAALVSHAGVNARAAADFLALGIPPFQYRWEAGLLRVSDTASGATRSTDLLPGDQIARIAGFPVEGSPQWRHHLLWRIDGRPLRRGQPLTLTIVRGGEARDVVVMLDGIAAAQAREVVRVRAMTLPAQVAGFALWLLAVLVLVRRRGPPAALFFLWCMALALYTARSAVAALLWDSYPPALIRLFQSGFITGWFLAPALFAHFCLLFVRPRHSEPGTGTVGPIQNPKSKIQNGPWRPQPLAFYLVPVLALLATQVPYLGWAVGRLLWLSLAVSWLGALALGLATLARARGETVDPLRRKQLEFVLAGSLAYSLVLLHAFVTVLAGWDVHPAAAWAWLPHLLLLGTPLAFAYAILRHRLLDIDLVIRRSLVYALLTLCMAGVFVVLQHLASTVLAAKTGAASLPAQTLAALAVAALFGPTERRIARAVESVFNRRQIERLEQLRLLGREIGFIDDCRLEHVLVQRLAEVTQVESVDLYWLDTNGLEYRWAAGTGRESTGLEAVSFRKNDSLANWLAMEGVPLDFAALPQEEIDRCLETAEKNRLTARGAALCVPMAVRGQLEGFLTLGARSDRDLCSPEEQEALQAIGSLAAAALQQATMARRLRDLERERDLLLERLYRLVEPTGERPPALQDMIFDSQEPQLRIEN